MDDTKELEVLNYEESKQHIGGVVFVSIMMIFGIIGNLHVLFVYMFRMKPSNPRTCILTLALLDMMTCVIGMPFIIIDLRNPLTFSMVTACKVLRFINYFICLASSFILTVIAVDRYRKICVPLGMQISQRLTKLMCVLCLIIAVVISWPIPVLYGHSSVNTTNPNITGVQCYTEDDFKKTKYQAYFNQVLIMIVLCNFFVLVVLYSLIGKKIMKQAVFKSSTAAAATSSYVKSRISEITTDKTTGDEKMSEWREEEMKSNFKNENGKTGFYQTNGNIKIEPAASSKDSSATVCTKQEYPKVQMKERDKFNRVKKTTFMLFLVTAFFFISYFPHLILKIVAFTTKDFVLNLSFPGKVLYNTFVWCFFINNMVNCFIYGFGDVRFRTEVKRIYHLK